MVNTSQEQVVGADNTSAAVYGGGTPPDTRCNEYWNGSAWTEVADLNHWK